MEILLEKHTSNSINVLYIVMFFPAHLIHGCVASGVTFYEGSHSL